MPDFDDELRDMLHDRAGRAPATPAPTDALVRRVRRRRAARLTLGVATSTACLAAVGVAVAVAAPVEKTTSPAAPPVTAQPTLTPDATPGDKYEFCTRPATDAVDVAVHQTEQKFGRGCYRVAAGTTDVRFENPSKLPHDLVIAREGGEAWIPADVLYSTEIVEPGNAFSGKLTFDLAAGDYRLTCTVHPLMHAQLVVR